MFFRKLRSHTYTHPLRTKQRVFLFIDTDHQPASNPFMLEETSPQFIELIAILRSLDKFTCFGLCPLPHTAPCKKKLWVIIIISIIIIKTYLIKNLQFYEVSEGDSTLSTSLAHMVAHCPDEDYNEDSDKEKDEDCIMANISPLSFPSYHDCQSFFISNSFDWYLLNRSSVLLPGTGRIIAITMFMFSLFEITLLESWLIVL